MNNAYLCLNLLLFMKKKNELYDLFKQNSESFRNYSYTSSLMKGSLDRLNNKIES